MLADRTVRAGPRKDPLWSSRGIMKILLVDRCLEREYGGGRISISQGRDVDASTIIEYFKFWHTKTTKPKSYHITTTFAIPIISV